MTTLIAILALALQEPPPPPGRPPAEQEQVLREKLEELKKRLEPLPEGSEEAKALQREYEGLLRQVRDLRIRRVGEGAPQPPRPPPQPPRPVENPDEVRAWLKDNEPETYRRVMEAQESGRRPDVMRMLSEAEPRMRQMNEMKERDPKGWERMKELRRLEGESVELADRARKAPAEERDRLGQQLGEMLGRLFDLREENRARDVAELKRRVETLEKELSSRRSNKEKIVDQRRRELLGARGELDW